jgi:hypothetical protein
MAHSPRGGGRAGKALKGLPAAADPGGAQNLCHARAIHPMAG